MAIQMCTNLYVKDVIKEAEFFSAIGFTEISRTTMGDYETVVIAPSEQGNARMQIKERWVDAQREHLLDAPYYHLVVMLPHELNPVFFCNQKRMYDLLFRSASETVVELASDSKHLGAKPGFIGILHTWGSDMGYHPHLHLLVLGGGLDDDRCWREKAQGFFLPVGVVSRVFRGKFMSGLKGLWRKDQLVFAGMANKYRNHHECQALLDACYQKEWVPYCKKSFSGAQSVLAYIGRYTHRIAISNSRILRMDEDTVTFRAKDYKNGGLWKELTVTGVEFIRRFLMHVLPKRFAKVRHYGLLSNRNKKTRIPICRNLIGCKAYLSELKGLSGGEILKKLYGIDVDACPCCGERLRHEQVNRARPHYIS